MIRKHLLVLVFLICIVSLGQQAQKYKVHSHNDYEQQVPFWKAISAGVSSLEADVFLVSDSLFVAHTSKEIRPGRDLETLYLRPLLQALKLNLETGEPIQLLIDVKTEAYATLEVLVKTLEKYPSLISSEQVAIVISGNRPRLEEYKNYPDYIAFDYQSLDPLPNQNIIDKIALISLNFRKFSDWNGKGRLTAGDFETVTKTIQKAHDLEKPFRFWGTPDSKTAWKAFAKMGVDYINTDNPFECTQYLQKLPQRVYQNPVISKVYRPNFKTDGKPQAVKNIILLIGDGNGLTQISATALANKGALSLTQFKNIGLLKTQSADDFTTDSAGAATAMATGKKAPNRAIGVDMEGRRLENITEVLSKKNYEIGILTTDEIIGATPAAFYAHQKDRAMADAISTDLLKSQISIFIAKSPESAFLKSDFGGFSMLESLEAVEDSKKDRVGYFFPKEKPSNKEPENLSGALKSVLHFLSRKDQPFFLMVEGAKIDSYGHANDIGGIIREGLAFDRAISEALQFADKNENTLVIVTADHETGGLTIPQGTTALNQLEGDFTTEDHTGALVPIFAYGPKSDTFRGVYENNLVFLKILEVLDIKVEE